MILLRGARPLRHGPIPLDFPLGEDQDRPDLAGAQLPVPHLNAQRRRRQPEKDCRLSDGEHLALCVELGEVRLGVRNALRVLAHANGEFGDLTLDLDRGFGASGLLVHRGLLRGGHDVNLNASGYVVNPVPTFSPTSPLHLPATR